MKSKLLLSAFVSFALTASSQENINVDSSRGIFQLKDYRYRTPGFRALEVGLNMAGSLSRVDTGAVATNSSLFLAPSPITYYRIVSTDRRLHTSAVRLVNSYASSSSKNDLNKASQRELHVSVDYTRNDKFFMHNNWFFELGNNLAADAGFSYYHDTGGTNRYSFSVVEDEVSLGVGRGRIEYVSDAQMAMYILEDLENQGLLDAPVTADITREFAQLITAVNNRRVFDSRRRRIYELEQIEAFLRDKGLVKSTGMKHFLVVNDNWAFAFNPQRLSGTSWFLRLVPGAGFQTSKSRYSNPVYENTQQEVYVTVSPVIGFEKYTPLNLHWQKDIGASVTFSSRDTWYEDYKYHHSRYAWLLEGFYGIGYIPNNRTSVNGRLNLQAGYDSWSPVNITYIQPQIMLSSNYFLGYRTRLFASFFAGYDFRHVDTGTSRTDHSAATSSFSLGLVHAFL